jgi:hypothetical protein
MSEHKTHELKLWPEFFGPSSRGLKSFEYRLNDRDYKVGDILQLREWHESTKTYTGRFLRRTITYVLDGFGLPEGYCILGVQQLYEGPREIHEAYGVIREFTLDNSPDEWIKGSVITLDGYFVAETAKQNDLVETKRDLQHEEIRVAEEQRRGDKLQDRINMLEMEKVSLLAAAKARIKPFEELALSSHEEQQGVLSFDEWMLAVFKSWKHAAELAKLPAPRKCPHFPAHLKDGCQNTDGACPPSDLNCNLKIEVKVAAKKPRGVQ